MGLVHARAASSSRSDAGVEDGARAPGRCSGGAKQRRLVPRGLCGDEEASGCAAGEGARAAGVLLRAWMDGWIDGGRWLQVASFPTRSSRDVVMDVRFGCLGEGEG